MTRRPRCENFDVGRQQLVRADDDVDRAAGQAFERRLDFLARSKARQLGHLHRPRPEAVDDRLVVLLGEQRRRREDRHLLAAEHGDEGRAQRDFGLAEADVAADQPVHRLGAHHVLDHGVDRGALVGRFLETEARGESFVVVRRIAVRVALSCGAACVQCEQFGRGVAHLLGGAAFGLLPLPRTELVQRRLFGRHAGVARDQVQLRHRHVERGLVGVLEVQELARTIAQVDVEQALVAADAVIHMHHRVADLQLRQVLDQRFNVADLFLLLASACRRRGGEELGLGEELDRCGTAFALPVESRGQRRGDDRDLFVVAFELGERRHGRHRNVMVAQQVEQALAAAFAFGDDQDAGRGRGQVLFECLQRLGGVAIDGHGRQGPGVFDRLRAAQYQGRMRVREREEVFAAQEDLFRRKDRPLRVVLQEAMALACVGPEANQRRVDLAVQHHGGN